MRLSSFTTLSATCLLSGLLAVPAHAETIDPNSAEGFVAINRKIQCSTEDSSPQVFEWSGYGYSRVPGEPDPGHRFSPVRSCLAYPSGENWHGRGSATPRSLVVFRGDQSAALQGLTGFVEHGRSAPIHN